MADLPVIAAAVAGALAGVLLLLRGPGRDTSNGSPSPSPRSSDALAATRPNSTTYEEKHQNSAAPILVALGLGLVGTGLALGSIGGGLDLLLVVPGGAVLLLAVAAMVRQRPRTPAQDARPSDSTTDRG